MMAFIGVAAKETILGLSIKVKLRLWKIVHAMLRKALYMPTLSVLTINMLGWFFQILVTSLLYLIKNEKIKCIIKST
jgi:hypothetical protein